MSVFEWSMLILVGVTAGILSGVLGIGGGVVIIPALIFVLGLSQQTAQGTSLAMMVPPIGIMAAINYHKAGYVNLKYAIILAIFFTIGAYLSSKIVISINPKILRKIFAVFLVFVAGKMFFAK